MSVEKKVTISNGNGLHARPAGKIVEIANQHDVDITIRHGDKSADARSIIALMTLTASCGSELEVEADGDGAEEAVNAIVSLIEDGFEE